MKSAFSPPVVTQTALLTTMLLLSACATQPGSVRTTLHRPPAHRPVAAAGTIPKPDAVSQTATRQTEEAVAPVATPVALPQAGSAIPMMGFRPMRGQAVRDQAGGV